MASRGKLPTFFALTAVLAFGLSSAGFAQAPSKDAGQPKADAPSVRVETTSYQNWNVICRSTVGSKEKPDCVAELRALDSRTKAVLIVWQIRRGKGKKLTTRVQTPTGVKMKPGVELKLGDDTLATLEYDFCTPQNCEAAGPLDEALVAKIDSASVPFHITVHGQVGQTVNIETATKGIKQATAALAGED